ncbi:MAG: ribonuclease HI [Candidatus Levybacteria bacterium]|nr:ribonuclease HI [Candidatus Levybacteria bacterium]
MQNIIFTDGSSRGNPGPGGWGAVVVLQMRDICIELGGREENTTNNRMEILAAICALEKVEKDSLNVIYTDSSYLINGITKWVHGWQMNGWKTKTKDDVLNKDLWQRLLSACENKKVDFKYVGGHIGVAGNERCDIIATSFADNVNTALYNGPLSGYPIANVTDVSQDSVKVKSKKSSKSRSNTQAFSYVSRVNGKVEVHSNWTDCEKKVKGAKGARFKKALNKIEEDDLVREFTEAQPQYAEAAPQ